MNAAISDGAHIFRHPSPPLPPKSPQKSLEASKPVLCPLLKNMATGNSRTQN